MEIIFDYAEYLFKSREKNTISLITGMRETGKTRTLGILAKRLELNGVPRKNIVHISHENYKKDNIWDSLKLYYFLQKKLLENGRKYLILDDIDFVDRWERAVVLIFKNYDVKIYISSENKEIFEKDIFDPCEYPYEDTRIFPLSFKESLEINDYNPTDTHKEKITEYAKLGSLPILYRQDLSYDEKIKIKEGIYSAIILKEVIVKKKIGDYLILNDVIEVIAENIGKNLSYNKIACLSEIRRNKTDNKINPASRTVESHIEMLKHAFLVYEIPRYDIVSDTKLKTLGKFYLNEIGFIDIIAERSTNYIQGVLENIIFLELMRRKFTVYNGKARDKQITFIAIRDDSKKYIQVVESIDEDGDLAKILSPLVDVKDKGECIIVYCNNELDINRYGDIINYMSAYDFLIQ